jgi:hypothetical protein
MYFVCGPVIGPIPAPTIRFGLFCRMMLNLLNILGSYGTPPRVQTQTDIAGWREGIST